MSTEHALDATELPIELFESPDAGTNRVVLYDWFSHAGSPPRADNRAEVLVDGEEAWVRVHQDLLAAQREVDIATWMCRPDMELVRPAALAVAEPLERREHRLGEVVEALARRGVTVRLLIWGGTFTPLVNRWLFRWFWRPRLPIELLEQDHSRLIGSHHQKTLTIDGRVGYCGGMNLKENDWDSDRHLVFEPRRLSFGARAAQRLRVAQRRAPPGNPPRHDLKVRIEGPAVADLLGNFRERWNGSLAARARSIFARVPDLVRGALGAAPHQAVGLLGPGAATPESAPGDRWVQIVRTVDRGEQSILDAYERAIANARKYIYIENQYFRSPTITAALKRALAKNPRLRLAVTLNPIGEGRWGKLFPQAHWTGHTQEAIQRLRPDFRLTRLIACEEEGGRLFWAPIDVHAKLMIIDDVWLTVGSANLNDRGFTYESEINAVMLDRRDARSLRLRLMAEHLGIPKEEAEAQLGDVTAAFDLWEARARENAAARSEGRQAQGFVHAFTQAHWSGWGRVVGPDVF